ncbi:multidrug transporter [Flagellimonas sp. S174]|uniref:multidrug transporter n=1 Tax=Flagellimonas sp. S174 TaxID=3410790 RepID=UPI003BF4861C
MKKSILLSALFLATISTVLVSCSDDEDPIPTPPTTGTDDDDPGTGGGDPLTEVEFDANGDWTQETLDAFADQLGVNADATGADESAFAFTTVSTTIGNTVLPTNFTATQTLSGEITSEVTLDANEVYEIEGAVFVRDGGTLNIPAGTFLFANSENNAAVSGDITAADVIVVNQGGTLNATGTADNPVIFSSSTQVSGSWGGIVLLGNAPINLSGGEGNAEIADNVGEDLPYGGTDATDSSGNLSYVILAYPGTQINTESEFNGFSFYGVGSGTTLNFLQVFQGQDDGFEWFGGTVDASNLFSEAFDDSFDWAEGFVGTLDNIIADQPSGADHCIEADNLSADNDAAPRSNPNVTNATFNSSGDDDAIRLRRGTAVQMDNIFFDISGNSRAHFEVDDVVTGQLILDGDTTFENIAVDAGNPAFIGNANN